MHGRNPDLKIIFVSGYAEDTFEKSLPRERAVRLPAEAVHAGAACRRREGDDAGGVASAPFNIFRIQSKSDTIVFDSPHAVRGA
jgi:hypothetical protein